MRKVGQVFGRVGPLVDFFNPNFCREARKEGVLICVAAGAEAEVSRLTDLRTG